VQTSNTGRQIRIVWRNEKRRSFCEKMPAYSILFANQPSLLGAKRHARGAAPPRLMPACHGPSPAASCPSARRLAAPAYSPPFTQPVHAGPLPSAVGRQRRLLISLRPPAPAFLPQLETNIGSKAKGRTGGALRAGSRAPIKGGRQYCL
jgi:hypothetical protein